MSKGKLLITGATGYVGSAILIGALREGYDAHIVVRSAAKEQFLKDAPAIAGLGKQAQCKYFVVPDLTVPGCLDEAAAGANLVIHAAAPLPGTEATLDREEAEIIQPAISITLNCLESARKVGTVKRVICLSSLAAFTRQAFFRNEVPTEEPVMLSPETVSDYWTPPYGGGLLTYSAAKTAALRRSLEWTREAVASSEGLGFDVIYTAFAYVIGRHPLAENVGDLFSGSNALILRSAVGTESSDIPEMSGGVHIDDVVKVHLKALDLDSVKTPAEGPNTNIDILTFSVLWNYDDINAAVERLFPEQVKQGLLPNQGHFKARPGSIVDTSRAEKVCKIEHWKGLEEQLQSALSQYLELLAKEKGKGPGNHKIWQTTARDQ
ncbi:putative 3-beta hydroxysteroid dehydrogenase protein [Seiridium cardinale]|uniref:3-beta hydroxysteroid dehydrogenase protein n=1 Tax=Seiridium cardinale TaxID=138064 RepID=A0ABR2XWH2_9PEZI